MHTSTSTTLTSPRVMDIASLSSSTIICTDINPTPVMARQSFLGSMASRNFGQKSYFIAQSHNVWPAFLCLCLHTLISTRSYLYSNRIYNLWSSAFTLHATHPSPPPQGELHNYTFVVRRRNTNMNRVRISWTMGLWARTVMA
jgi:hypothetical protein